MTQTIATWRCKCGTRVIVKAETDRNTPIVFTVSASCPGCGDKQQVYAHRIVEVAGENEQQIQSRSK